MVWNTDPGYSEWHGSPKIVSSYRERTGAYTVPKERWQGHPGSGLQRGEESLLPDLDGVFIWVETFYAEAGARSFAALKLGGVRGPEA